MFILKQDKNNLKRGLFLIGIVLPIITYFLVVLKYSVNIPYSDDYNAVLHFLSEYISTTSFSEKFRLISSQHNEHRIVFDRLIFLLNYYTFKEVNFIFLIITGNISLLFISFILYNFFVKIDQKEPLYFLPVLFLFFQLQYQENSIWAMASLQNFYVILFSFAALYCLSAKHKISFIFALILALTATFTSGSGLLSFIVGALLLIYQRRFKWELPIWIFIAGISIFLYFKGYVKPGVHPDIVSDILTKPLQMAGYFLAFNGSIFNLLPKGGWIISIIMGSCSLLFLLYLTKIKYYERNSLIFSFIILLIMTSASITLSRAGFGIEQAFTSRYKFITTLIFVLYYIIIIDLYHKWFNYKHLIAFILVSVGFNIASLLFNIEAMRTHDGSLVVGGILYESTPRSNAYLAHHDLHVATVYMQEAYDRGIYKVPEKILPFDVSKQVKLTLPQPTNNITNSIDIINYKDYFLLFNSWAIINEVSSEDNKIFIALQSDKNTLLYDTHKNIRPDVSSFFKANHDDAGFTCVIPKKDLTHNKKYKIGIYITKNNSSQAFQFSEKTLEHKSFSLISNRIKLPEIYSLLSFNVEHFSDNEAILEMKGWGHIADESSVNAKLYIVLKSDKKTYIFESLPEKRLDVTAYFPTNHLNLDDSGFFAYIDKRRLETGNYQIGLLIVKSDGRESFQLINKQTSIHE